QLPLLPRHPLYDLGRRFLPAVRLSGSELPGAPRDADGLLSPVPGRDARILARHQPWTDVVRAVSRVRSAARRALEQLSEHAHVGGDADGPLPPAALRRLGLRLPDAHRALVPLHEAALPGRPARGCRPRLARLSRLRDRVRRTDP